MDLLPGAPPCPRRPPALLTVSLHPSHYIPHSHPPSLPLHPLRPSIRARPFTVSILTYSLTLWPHFVLLFAVFNSIYASPLYPSCYIPRSHPPSSRAVCPSSPLYWLHSNLHIHWPHVDFLMCFYLIPRLLPLALYILLISSLTAILPSSSRAVYPIRARPLTVSILTYTSTGLKSTSS